MKRKSKKPTIAWSQTPEASKAYETARAEAQRKANETGFDFGLEANELFKEYRSFMLPQRENRYGFETRCEVVMCEILDKCQKGHGPVR